MDATEFQISSAAGSTCASMMSWMVAVILYGDSASVVAVCSVHAARPPSSRAAAERTILRLHGGPSVTSMNLRIPYTKPSSPGKAMPRRTGWPDQNSLRPRGDRPRKLSDLQERGADVRLTANLEAGLPVARTSEEIMDMWRRVALGGGGGLRKRTGCGPRADQRPDPARDAGRIVEGRRTAPARRRFSRPAPKENPNAVKKPWAPRSPTKARPSTGRSSSGARAKGRWSTP